MISLYRSAAVAGLWLVAGSLAHGQTPSVLLEDDFSRDGWENAQTNTALPDWSTPGTGGFTPPAGGVPFVGEVVVTGTQFQIRANGQVYLSLDDPDLAPGTVGVMSWGQRGGTPAGGTRVESLTVENAQSQSVFQENWQHPISTWKTIAPSQANGTPADPARATGNFRWEFTSGSILEDSDLFTAASTVAPKTDFIGPTIAYGGPGSNAWADYHLRTRITAVDDDGIGVIVRCFEDAQTLKFYRVSFAGTQAQANTRPTRGIGVQKAVMNKSTGTTQWTLLLDDAASIVYDSGKPFDLSVRVRNVSAAETRIEIDVVNDAVANPTPIPTLTVSDTSDPITSGSVGLTAWAINTGRWSNYGGSSTPFLVTLDAQPATLLGDIFSGPYNNWKTTMSGTPAGGNTNQQRWGVLLLGTTDLLENSDGRQGDGTTTGGVPDGRFTPFILVQDGFDSGTHYTLRATLKTDDNDGEGLVFGYKDNDNYFRVAFRNEAGSNFGFPTGISVQKIVGGVTTNLAVSVGRALRSNLAGIWVRKLMTGTLEQSDNAGLYDGANAIGTEYQGPRLVRGDVNWTDYTYESVIETNDNDGIGLLFRYQDEKNHYRLTFQSEAQTAAGAPPAGIALQRVANGVYTELFRDTDPTKSGDNDSDPTAGFIYDPLESSTGYKLWRTRVVAAAGTFRIEIDAILSDGTEFPNYYVATVTDPAPLASGKVGLHTWGHNANEFRQIRLTLAGETEPAFVDGAGQPDPKGWVDASSPAMADPANVAGEDAGSAGTAAGALISGFGIRVDLDALGVRDNRYVGGSGQDASNLARGTVDFDGPRAVAGEPNWKDYSYQVDIKTLDDDGVGILFRYQDEANFYRLMFMSQGNNNLGPPPQGVSVQKRRGGVWSELFWSGSGGDHFIYRPGEAWNVELTAQGADFTATITQVSDYDGDGKTLYKLSFSDPIDPLLTGKIGVTCWGSKGQANEGNGLLVPAGLDWTKHFNEAAVFDNVRVIGTVGRLAPDLNADGLIDPADYLLWSECLTGPAIPMVNPTPTCRRSDIDLDDDVDVEDFGLFQRCFAGAEPFDPSCVD